MNKYKIEVASPVIGNKELEYVTDAVRSGWVSSRGKYINLFEEKFSEYVGAKYSSTTMNGTVALHLALLALNIGKGDEVILPSLTFISTANAIRYVGATPIFVDVNEKNWNISPDNIKEKINSKTKAIIAVHLYGHPAEMDELSSLAREFGLFLIEDAAEALGAEYKGKKVGSLGDVSIFSFYGNKIITTGEGGMISTNNSKINQQVNLLKNHGMSPTKRYWHEVVGFNYRMTNLQAALGLAQMESLDSFIIKKREIRASYQRLIEAKSVVFQSEENWAKSANWMISIKLDPTKTDICRDLLMSKMSEAGIESRPVFPLIHKMPPYKHYLVDDLINSSAISDNGINLPSSCSLDFESIDYISNVVNEALEE